MAKSPLKLPPQKAVESLIDEYGRDCLLVAMNDLLALAVWKPTCDKTYEYTYEYIVKVDDCDLTEAQEQQHEAHAERLCLRKVKRYCKRNDKCKKVEIVSSAPVGGGCNCVNLPIAGLACAAIVRWKIEYKCVDKAGAGGSQEF